MKEKKTECCKNCYCCAKKSGTGTFVCMNADSGRYGNKVFETEKCSYFEPKNGWETKKGVH